MVDNVYFKDLSPVSFLDRSAYVYPDKTAIAYGEKEYTYSEFYSNNLSLLNIQPKVPPLKGYKDYKVINKNVQ